MGISRRKRTSWLSFIVMAFLMTVCLMSILTVPKVHAAPQSATPTDPNIKYVGRWDTSSSTVYTSYWPGAYFETQFTGTTVAIKLAQSANIYVRIDGGTDTFYANANGTVNLTPSHLASGTHLLRVAAYTETDFIAFQGLVLDAGATTVAPVLSSKLIEFIGDSITAGATDSKRALSDYAWLIGEQLGVQHTQIAQGGICLVDNVACPDGSSIGMSRQYFKLQTVAFPNSPNWDFSRYQANAVVINLGTNDSGRASTSAFQSTYVTFLRGIRSEYPGARIFVLRTFGGYEVAPTQAAIQTVGDSNVQYVDTTGWLSSSDFNNDGLHPSDAGMVKVANRLGPIISAYLGTGTTPTPTPTPIHTPTPTPGSTPTATPTGTTGASCRVHYAITNQWQGGFGASLTITNTGTTAINGWNLQFSFPNGQAITQLWNGTVTQSGSAVTIINASYNGQVPAGATVNPSPGFNGSWTGSNAAPPSFTLNGQACSMA